MAPNPLDDLGTEPLEVPLTLEAKYLLARCDNLLGTAEWALDTIEGIAETVRATGIVTPNQLRAIENIESAAERPRDSSRRYEGWGRR